MNTEERIILCNDDGVFNKGIQTLARFLGEQHSVRILAPENDMSAASSCLTITKPLFIRELDSLGHAIQGTPADCGHIAASGVFASDPQRIIAGINIGANMGDDTIYSGTVAAALEGRFLEKPPIAVSLVGEQHVETAARVVVEILKSEIAHNYQEMLLLNVNVPDVPFEEIQGYQVTRTGRRGRPGKPLPTLDAKKRECFWLGEVGEPSDASEGTDFYALKHNFVSITPLHTDLTNYRVFEQVKKKRLNGEL